MRKSLPLAVVVGTLALSVPFAGVANAATPHPKMGTHKNLDGSSWAGTR